MVRPRQVVSRTELWGPDGHPAKGLAQPDRKQREPIDRKAIIRMGVMNEIRQVCRACNVPSEFLDREDMAVEELLAEHLRAHFERNHLIAVRICNGMTIGEVADETARVLADRAERKRLGQVAAQAVGD